MSAAVFRRRLRRGLAPRSRVDSVLARAGADVGSCAGGPRSDGRLHRTGCASSRPRSGAQELPSSHYDVPEMLSRGDISGLDVTNLACITGLSRGFRRRRRGVWDPTRADRLRHRFHSGPRPAVDGGMCCPASGTSPPPDHSAGASACVVRDCDKTVDYMFCRCIAPVEIVEDGTYSASRDQQQAGAARKCSSGLTRPQCT